MRSRCAGTRGSDKGDIGLRAVPERGQQRRHFMLTEPEINENGTKRWYLNDQLHRSDGPAVEYANGEKVWYLNGKLHRTDGPAVEYANGTKVWYLNGKLHRTDGPAAEGPAAERVNGTKEWWVNGRKYSFKQYVIAAKWTGEQIVMEKLCQNL